jgi:hypothetical protein
MILCYLYSIRNSSILIFRRWKKIKFAMALLLLLTPAATTTVIVTQYVSAHRCHGGYASAMPSGGGSGTQSGDGSGGGGY